MNLIVSNDALKALNKMPGRDSEAMRRKLKTFAIDPFAPYPWAKALVGGGVRIRQGDWRAICDIDGKALVVTVIKVGNRREVYR